MNRRQRDSYTEAFAWKLCAAYQAQVLCVSIRTAEENMKAHKGSTAISSFWYDLAVDVLGKCMEARNKKYERDRGAGKDVPTKVRPSSKNYDPIEFH